MLRKLSLRFTAAAVAALLCVELLMVVLINGLNIYYTVSQTDDVLKIITDNQGQFPERDNNDNNDDKDKPQKPKDERGSPVSRQESEMRYVTRFFTVMLNADNVVDRIDTGNISSVSSDEAQSYALDVLANYGESGDDSDSDNGEVYGFYDNYSFRYAVKTTPDNGKIAVFYDFSQKSDALKRMVEISAFIAAVLLVIFSVIIRLLSVKAVRPVILNIENQRRFVTDAGHELKTPLAIIRADTEVIELTQGQSEWTQSIVNQTDRLSELLSQMLTLTKSQETVKLNFQEFDFSELLRQKVGEFAPLCSTQNKPADIKITDGIHCMGDRTLVETLISILLDNALKYGTEGETIGVVLKAVGGRAVFSVSNICDEPPKDTKMLFARFYRADSSRTRETGGSGIGLSIARSIADAHKARLGCTVEGNRITFEFKHTLVKKSGLPQ